MKKIIHIVIVESSDVLYQGLSTMLYNSEDEYFVSRLLSFENVETILINKRIDVLFINPMLIFNNAKGVKKLRKNYPSILITCLNMNILDNNTLSLYDFTMNIYDSSPNILSVVNKQLKQKLSEEDGSYDEALSERETEVLLQIIRGITNKEIADILCISVHTVISHRKNIMLKTGIRSQAGLALYAVSKSLISLDSFDL